MLEMHSTKATAVGESNKRGSWGGVPSVWRPTGDRGQSPRRCGNFTAIFFQNTHF